jgi:hypothetical protein
MVKYIIVLNRPMQINYNIVECIGPFDSIQLAIEWLMEWENKHGLPPIHATVRTIWWKIN